MIMYLALISAEVSMAYVPIYILLCSVQFNQNKEISPSTSFHRKFTYNQKFMICTDCWKFTGRGEWEENIQRPSTHKESWPWVKGCLNRQLWRERDWSPWSYVFTFWRRLNPGLFCLFCKRPKTKDISQRRFIYTRDKSFLPLSRGEQGSWSAPVQMSRSLISDLLWYKLLLVSLTSPFTAVPWGNWGKGNLCCDCCR